MEKRELNKYIVIGVIATIVCLIVKNFGFVIKLIKFIFIAAYPLLLGCMIAFIFNIFLGFCENHYFPKRKKGFIAYSRRPICLIISIAFVIAMFALLLNLVIPELVNAFKIISMAIPDVAVKVKDIALDYMGDYPEIQDKIMAIDINWNSVTEKAIGFISVGAGGLISSIAGFISAFTLSVTRIVIAVIFAVYLLLRKDKLKCDIKRIKNAYLKEKTNTILTHIFHTANETFRSFFVGQFLEAIILGLLCMAGMYCFKIPYAAMTGAVIGVTAIIPIVGAYLGAGIGAFIICTDSPIKALEFLIILVIIQQFEGNVIYPKVVGSSVGLPGIWVLAAVTVGGSLCGIMGMLLGVPVAATIYKLCHEELGMREASLGIAPPEEPMKEPKIVLRKCGKKDKSRKKNNRKK
ncbi:MAG: AI-2E family transporter [Ruminococcus sp.]|nr:AI-2E family transporter [Oscillospiraceae bacterium]